MWPHLDFAGALFETFVATELERQASWSPEPLSFWHYREDEREVDAIISVPRPLTTFSPLKTE